MVGFLLIPVCLEDSNPDLYVFVIAGQSNAEYAGTGISDMNDSGIKPDAEVLYYGSASMPIQCGYKVISGTTYLTDHDSSLNSYSIHSMYHDNQWIIGCLESIIAGKISDRSHTNILIINVAIGGASVDMLQPTNIGGQYVKNVIDDALSKVPSKYNIVKLGYAWLQGEADAATAIDTYKQKFGVINGWYESQGFDKCYLVQTRPYDGGNASTAQLEICSSDPDVYLASTAPQGFTVANGLMNADNRHYSGEGRFIVGSQIGSMVILKDLPEDDTNHLIQIIPLIVICSLIVIAATWIRRE